MTVVLSAVCDRCRSEYRPERAVSSFSPGAVRTRAALYGWAQREWRGVVVDLCPACLQEALPVPQRAAGRVLAGATSASTTARTSGAAVVHGRVLDVDVAACRWCADGEHQWCSGCDCAAHG